MLLNPFVVGYLPIPETWQVAVSYVFDVIVALLFCAKEKVQLWKAFDFHLVRIQTLLLTVVIFLAIQPIMTVIAGLTDRFIPSLMEVIKEQMYAGNLFVNLVGISLIPAFFEEFLIRGALVGAYRRTGRLRATILLSALAFGLLHANLSQFFYTFVAGIVLAALYILSGSIWPGILLHFLNNGASVVEEAIKQKYGEEVAKRAFYVSHMELSPLAFALAFFGAAIIVFTLRAIAKQEGNERLLGPCVKGGDGTKRLITSALVGAFVIVFLMTVLISGAAFIYKAGMIPEGLVG